MNAKTIAITAAPPMTCKIPWYILVIANTPTFSPNVVLGGPPIILATFK